MRQLTRRDLIKAALSASALGIGGSFRRALGQGSATAPFVLWVHCDGGWDTTMVLDDKLNSPHIAVEPGAMSATSTTGLPFIHHPDRPAVADFFDTYGSRAVIVNGISCGSMVRRFALTRMMGATPPSQIRPCDWLSYYTSILNPVLDLPHAVIDAPFMPGEYVTAAVKLTTAQIQDMLAAPSTAETLSDDAEAALLAFRQSQLDVDFTKKAHTKSLDATKLRALYYGYARQDAIKARLQDVDTALGAQGSDTNLQRHGKLAVELFATGASQCVTIQAGSTGQWDTNVDNYARQSSNYEMLFTALKSTLAYAQSRGIADQMLMIVTSEMGRSPNLNAQDGKGPWPYTSALLWGSMLQGGAVIGATDNVLRGLPIDPLFGTVGEDAGPTAITLEMATVMSAIYLNVGVSAKFIMPKQKPLTPILRSET